MPWWIPLLAFTCGVIVGLFSVRRFRRDRLAWAKRRLQLQVLSLELKSLRQKVVSADGPGTPPATASHGHQTDSHRLQVSVAERGR